jgi:drug/metabolite transporter (DMT)-like permease
LAIRNGPISRRSSPCVILSLSKDAQVLPYILLGGAQLAVGAAAIFARYALTGAGPIAVAATRLWIAAIVLLLIATVSRKKMQRPSTRQNVLLAGAGIALAVHFAAWIWSLEYATIAVSVLLVSTTPIWTAMYDAVVHKRGLSLASMLAFAAGAVGLVLVVGFDTTPPPHPGHELAGGALALLGSLAIGAYFILVRETRTGLETRAIVTRTFTWAAIALAIAALAVHQSPPPLQAHTAWFGIIAMALISQLIGHTALNASLKWFSASTVAFTTLLEPVFAAVLGLLVFRESIPPGAIVGAVILLGAIATVLREETITVASTA